MMGNFKQSHHENAEIYPVLLVVFSDSNKPLFSPVAVSQTSTLKSVYIRQRDKKETGIVLKGQLSNNFPFKILALTEFRT